MGVRPSHSSELRRVFRLAAQGVGGALAICAAIILSAFIPVWFQMLPRWFARGVTIGFLWTVVGVFLSTLVLAPLGLIAAGYAVGRARSRRQPWLRAARVVLFCISCLLGAGILEAGAAIQRALAERAQVWIPRSISAESHTVDPSVPRSFADESDDVLRLVVIGESSARGEPYHPWLSIGQIVAWQLEQVLGRRVEVDIRADSGLNLEQAIKRLKDLEVRPNAILVYSGHNEFSAHCAWDRSVSYYATAPPYRPPQRVFLEAAAGRSAVCALVRDSLERHRLDVLPPPEATRPLVDVPVCTSEEYARWRTDFQRRLEEIVRYCEEIRALPLLVIPASNDGDFAPSRSVMTATSSADEREAFARDFEAARALETTNPAGATAAFRALLERQPGFAEAHYRLGRLLDRNGQWAEARLHYVAARDLDGLPLRCPSDFQQAYRDVAAAHDVVLVDSPAVLARLGRHGILDDRLFHDAHHPNLKAYVALAQALLDRLHARQAFGWPAARATPIVSPAQCASHFGLDTERWIDICNRSAHFYVVTAYTRHDPSDRLEKARSYKEAALTIAAGGSLDDTGLASLGY